jgi:hypothetical protein
MRDRWGYTFVSREPLACCCPGVELASPSTGVPREQTRQGDPFARRVLQTVDALSAARKLAFSARSGGIIAAHKILRAKV